MFVFDCINKDHTDWREFEEDGRAKNDEETFLKINRQWDRDNNERRRCSEIYKETKTTKKEARSFYY